MVDFEDFIKIKYETNPKLYSNFVGITKKNYPKWGGWAILKEYRSRNVPITEISDPTLEVLVKNLYYLEYMEATLK